MNVSFHGHKINRIRGSWRGLVHRARPEQALATHRYHLVADLAARRLNAKFPNGTVYEVRGIDN
jgi:hypothetical protein